MSDNAYTSALAALDYCLANRRREWNSTDVRLVTEARDDLAAALITRPTPDAQEARDGQVLPSGWRVSIERGVYPEVLYLSLHGPQCSTCDQVHPGDDVKRRIYERFAAALALPAQGEGENA